jgi:hypothetical protein
VLSEPGLYSGDQLLQADSDTFTTALQKGDPAPLLQIGPRVPGAYKYEVLALQVGEVLNL